MRILRAITAFSPVAMLVTGACFATRNDVRILQGDIQTVRLEAARADSMRARQLAAVQHALGTVADSLKDASERLTRYQGDTRGDLRALSDMMIKLHELVGQSSAQILKMRADAEARAAAQSIPVVPDSSASATGTPPGAAIPNPGPNQLFDQALSQFRRGSYDAAQMAFEDLLRLYPQADLIADARYYLAETYDALKSFDKADSTFASVVALFPRSPRAPASLYKMALSLDKRRRRPEARVMMTRVTKEYPTSDEAEFARDWLTGHP